MIQKSLSYKKILTSMCLIANIILQLLCCKMILAALVFEVATPT